MLSERSSNSFIFLRVLSVEGSSRYIRSTLCGVSRDGNGPAALAWETLIDAWNNGDQEAVLPLFSDDATYEDTIYSRPFRGRRDISRHLTRARHAIPSRVRFVKDKIIGTQSTAAALWHLETNNGTLIPFSRGASFLELDSSGRIYSIIDIPEPSAKLGPILLPFLSVLLPLFLLLDKFKTKSSP